MGKRRKFTPKFKAQVIIESLECQSSQALLCRKYGIGADLLTRWRKHFIDNASKLFSDPKTDRGYIERLAQLEQLVGRLTLDNEIQKKASSYFS